MTDALNRMWMSAALAKAHGALTFECLAAVSESIKMRVPARNKGMRAARGGTYKAAEQCTHCSQLCGGAPLSAASSVLPAVHGAHVLRTRRDRHIVPGVLVCMYAPVKLLMHTLLA